jgi:hypothetical protein
MFLDGLGRGVKHLLSTFFAINTLPIIGRSDYMLTLYYKDLYTYGERMLYYADAGLNAVSIEEQFNFLSTAQMYKRKYEQMERMTFLQKLFYKRES